MSEEIVILDPPEPLIIDYEKIKIKKEIEITLYNKTNNNILCKSISINPNIFEIKNTLSIIKPYSSQNIQISFINNQNNLTNNKYEIEFDFYKLNTYISNSLELNKIIKDKTGNENQKINVNIYLKNKLQDTKTKSIEDNNYINKFYKFKNDLSEINNCIKKSIQSYSNETKLFNKNKIIAFIIILSFVLISGFIFGLFLAKQYKKLFKKDFNKNINNIVKDDEDYIPIKFMSVKEADDIKEVVDENIIKFNQIKGVDMLNEAKKLRIKDFEELNKFNNNNKKNHGNLIGTNFILIFISLILLFQ